MIKKKRIRLKMSDGYDVKDLSELQSHADLDSILHYFHTGELRQWLQERYYDDEAEKLDTLCEEDEDFLQKLCEVIGIQYNPVQLEISLPSEKIEEDCENREEVVSYTNMKNHDLATEVQNSSFDLSSKESPSDTKNTKFNPAAVVIPDDNNAMEEKEYLATNQIAATSQASTNEILEINSSIDESEISLSSVKLKDTNIQTNELTNRITSQDHNQDIQRQEAPAVHVRGEVSKFDDIEATQRNPSQQKEHEATESKAFITDSPSNRASILDFFSTKKRLNRKKYILRLLILCAFLIAVITVFAITDTMLQIPAFMPLAMLAASIIFWISFLMATICRLHDLGRSGWWCVILFVPYVNLVFAIYLILFKGSDGPNKYGDDPLAMPTESN